MSPTAVTPTRAVPATPSSLPVSSTSAHPRSLQPAQQTASGPRIPHENRSYSASNANTVPRRAKSSNNINGGLDGAAWGSNFWVTLVDPQSQLAFYACPATGEVSWDAPVNNFVMPPSEHGEWWELHDETRNLPYYYHNKSQQTVWARPEGFVIPLGIIQQTSLGKRLSQTNFEGYTQPKPEQNGVTAPNGKPQYRRSRSYTNDPELSSNQHLSPPSATKNRSSSTGYYSDVTRHNGTRLPPIPGSATPSISSRKSIDQPVTPTGKQKQQQHQSNSQSEHSSSHYTDASTKSRSKSFVTHTPPKPQSLNAALEYLSNSDREVTPPRKSSSRNDGESSSETPTTGRSSTSSRWSKKTSDNAAIRTGGTPSLGRVEPSRTYGGKPISAPILNTAAALNMSPVKSRKQDKPIPIQPLLRMQSTSTSEEATLPTGTYPVLPQDLASDIQQFSESDFARQYFATHKTGFMFRRTVPVNQMMTWQKAPLSSPLLALNRTLGRDAVKLFKVIQHIMGDREWDRSVGGVRLPDARSTLGSMNGSSQQNGILEEERWLLNEGLAHGELRDEIYCQTMKQLNGNSNPESIFKGWQLMCVLLVTFPPSKNFETYLRAFIQQHTTQTEGRVDIMAKHCLRRLAFISQKGPRGKPPATAEIEIASDAAFSPSTFGESLDAIFRLQERTYPHQKIPIILPFLADGILALGGTKFEGIFRVPGDGDLVSDLKLRIDRGYYSLEGVDDPHVLASLMKLWLRELCDPLVPAEMYNECITCCEDKEACIEIIKRLPTINRRVVLFVISFLQSFLEEKVQAVTKMTPVNLTLVMAPNLLRCGSENMMVVFTNSQFEQRFVHTLLLYLNCNEVDPDYTPLHGLGSITPSPSPASKSRPRRR